MLRFKYLIRSMLRKPLRTALTVVAVAAPLLVYVLAMSIVRTVERALDQSVKQMRLAVVQKTSIINPLPVGHRAKIEALDPTGQRIVAVCGMRWFGGRVPGTQTENYFIAADVDTFPKTYPEYQLTPQEIAAWETEKRAAVVGRAPANHFGWKIGDLITLESTVPPYHSLELKIVAIPQDTIDAETSFLRFDYFNEALKEKNVAADRASFFFVKCAARKDLEYFRQAIDDRFSTEVEQTKTQDEKSFMESFIAAQFDLPNKLRRLSLVVVGVAVMAAANTMMMSFRDRIREYGVFKALGFSTISVAGLLAAESLLLSIIGGFVGAGGPYAAFRLTSLRDMRLPMIGVLQIPDGLLWESIAVAALIGLTAAIFPAVRIARLNVVAALKRLG